MFEPHEIEWTPELVRRFWDNYGSPDDYFAAQVGHSLLAHVSRRIAIRTAVDLGCGRGDLIARLIQSGHPAYGFDQSPESLRAVQDRFAGHPLFRGIEPVSADTVFMLEVIEHLDDTALASLFADARRLLVPGGHIVITTPNSENLDRSKSMCPECGSIFHHMQHVRTWTADSLKAYAGSQGFQAISAEATLLTNHSGFKAAAHRLLNRMKGFRPHLVYIGQTK